MKSNLNNRITFLSNEPVNVKLMPCPTCKIATNHFRTPAGWQCRVCDDVVQESILEQRQETILHAVAKDPGLLTDDVVEELADLGKSIDGGAQ